MTIAPNISARLLVVAVLCVLSVGRSSTQAPSPADGPWAGWIRCQVTAQAQGYSDQQIHTWILSGDASRIEGVFRIFPATWSVVGNGSLQRAQGGNTVTGQWATNGQAPSAPIAVSTRGDGRLVFALRHDQLRAPGGFTGYRFYTVDGKRQTPESLAAETYEYRFTTIDAATANAVNGSTTVAIQPSTAYLPQPGSTGSASCTWQFGVGAAAPAPPQALQAQATPRPPAPGAAPEPTPPLTAGTPTTPTFTPANVPSIATVGPATQTPTVANVPSSASAAPALTQSTAPANGPISEKNPAPGAAPAALTADAGRQSTQDAISSCTLRGPDRNVQQTWANVNQARLVWTALGGVTSYTVLRSDVGVLTTPPLPATTTYYVDRTFLRPGSSYLYIVKAQYTQGCGVSTFTVSPVTGSLNMNVFTNNLPSGTVQIDATVEVFSGNLAAYTGLHLEGPGLPQGGKDIQWVNISQQRIQTQIVGVARGPQTWKGTAYWDTAEGRFMGASRAATANVP